MRRLPGHFVSALLDQDALHGPRFREGRGAAGVLVDPLPDALQGVVVAQSVETVVQLVRKNPDMTVSVTLNCRRRAMLS